MEKDGKLFWAVIIGISVIFLIFLFSGIIGLFAPLLFGFGWWPIFLLCYIYGKIITGIIYRGEEKVKINKIAFILRAAAATLGLSAFMFILWGFLGSESLDIKNRIVIDLIGMNHPAPIPIISFVMFCIIISGTLVAYETSKLGAYEASKKGS